MAYAPTEVAAVEQLITAERSQREQLAREERQRREADERARVQAAQVAASGDAGSSGSGSSNAVDYGMDWGYDTHDIYVPPEYQSELKYRQYFTFREYYWETTETRPGYSYQSYDKVYFSVHLKNNASRPVNVVQTGMWALAGAGLASFLGAKGEDGLVAGAAYGLARQHSENQRFTKEKPFSVTLGPNEERYETGAFPINKQLAESPTFHFLGVD